MTDTKSFKGLKVGGDGEGRTYELDGNYIDLKDDKNEKVAAAIKAYKPNRGEYSYNEEDNVILPAGQRAGTGDTWMYPDERRARTHTPVQNSFDDIGRKAMEETKLADRSPGAGVTDDKAFEKEQKDLEQEEKKAAEQRNKDAKKREAQAKKNS